MKLSLRSQQHVLIASGCVCFIKLFAPSKVMKNEAIQNNYIKNDIRCEKGRPLAIIRFSIFCQAKQLIRALDVGPRLCVSWVSSRCVYGQRNVGIIPIRRIKVRRRKRIVINKAITHNYNNAAMKQVTQ